VRLDQQIMVHQVQAALDQSAAAAAKAVLGAVEYVLYMN
jgi:hypothetical protein